MGLLTERCVRLQHAVVFGASLACRACPPKCQEACLSAGSLLASERQVGGCPAPPRQPPALLQTAALPARTLLAACSAAHTLEASLAGGEAAEGNPTLQRWLRLYRDENAIPRVRLYLTLGCLIFACRE